MTKAWSDSRPKNYYRDCVDRPRPCPWVGCKHHLLLDVNEKTGSITLNIGRVTKLNGPGRRATTEKRRMNTISSRNGVLDARNTERLESGTEKLFEEFEEILNGKQTSTCVLDCVAGERSYTLEEVGSKLSVTRERIRQIESTASGKLKALATEPNNEYWLDIKD